MRWRSLLLLTLLNKVEVVHPLHTVGHKTGAALPLQQRKAVTMRAPRRDVLRNRQRVVAAARAAFVELGPDVSLEEIARRAGARAPTLYRHFPDSDRLVPPV